MKKLFEPITGAQIKKINATIKEKELTKERIYLMIERLIGIPSMSAMSKQEACFILEKIIEKTTWTSPPPARTGNQIDSDVSALPYLGHIVGIRMIIREIDWSKDHFKAWLEKYMHVPNIRKLTRKRARDAFVALKKIQEHKQDA